MNTPEHLTPEKIAELRATFADSEATNTEKVFDLILAAPALLVAAELGMASRWIPVTERLPEFGAKASGIKRESCITLSEAGVIAMNWTENTYAVTAKGKRPRWEWNHRVSPWVVTHWMPLPSPPDQLTGRIGS